MEYELYSNALGLLFIHCAKVKILKVLTDVFSVVLVVLNESQ